MCSKLPISRQVLRLFEAPQELLLLFSYILVSRISINFSEGFRLLLNICDSTWEKGQSRAFFQNRVIATVGKSRL